MNWNSSMLVTSVMTAPSLLQVLVASKPRMLKPEQTEELNRNHNIMFHPFPVDAVIIIFCEKATGQTYLLMDKAVDGPVKSHVRHLQLL